MALLNCRFFSEALRESTTMTVILPESAVGQIGMETVEGSGKPPVLYLLHGLSDDDSIWLRRTSIERYAAALGIAVVMPKVGRSFYADEAVGQDYWQFVAHELPAMIGKMFNVSSAREDTFVAGLSMGGYGAFKLALRHPERFAAAASLSGAMRVGGSVVVEALKSEVPQVWMGQDPEGSLDDLLHLVQTADAQSLPMLYQVCGQQDFLYQDNLDFADAAKEAGVLVESHLDGPGDHDWQYWDDEIRKVLDWLPLSQRLDGGQ